MAAIIQILLPLLCVLLAQGIVARKLLHPLDKPSGTDVVDIHTVYNRINPEVRPNSDDRPINGDVFSYNTHHTYDNYYHDSTYDPGMNFGYPGFGNFDNMPLVFPNIYDRFHRPHYIHDGSKPNEKPDINEHSGERNGEDKEKVEDKLQSEGQKDEPKSPDVNKESEESGLNKNSDKTGDKKKVVLKPNKDYLLVGSNGNNVYLLHESTPNPNGFAVPTINQPSNGNNVVYVPYNPQQPNNQGYQLPNGQPLPTNIPMTPNKVNTNDYNNAVPNPVQNNVPANNNPSYVLLYANGQLIQIPGIVVSQQPNYAPVQNVNQASNAVMPNTAPMPNIVYISQPNQGNNPMGVQMPVSATPNGATPVYIQNPQYVANPNNVPNNNLGGYVVVSQPNNVVQPTNQIPSNIPNGYVQPNNVAQPTNQIPNNIPNGYVQPNNVVQPTNQIPNNIPNGYVQPNNVVQPTNQIPNNIPNGYVQPNGMTNVGNQGIVGNPVNTNPSVSVNNQPIQPAYAVNMNSNNNQIVFPTAQQKDPAPNNVPAPNENAQPVTEPPQSNNNVVISSMGIQPAVMVSGFKENENENKDKEKKEEADTKELANDKDEVEKKTE